MSGFFTYIFNFLGESTTKSGLSFQKYASSDRVDVKVSYCSGVLSEYAKKSGGLEKSKDWNGRSLIVPLTGQRALTLEDGICVSMQLTHLRLTNTRICILTL